VRAWRVLLPALAFHPEVVTLVNKALQACGMQGTIGSTLELAVLKLPVLCEWLVLYEWLLLQQRAPMALGFHAMFFA
jgi:hypothetical protein